MNLSLKNPWIHCLLVCAFTSLPVCADNKQGHDAAAADLMSLDTHFQQLSAHFYPELIRFDRYKKTGDIDSLVRKIDQYRKQDKPVRATALIIDNLNLVEKYADTTPILRINSTLLESDEWGAATKLYNMIKSRADKSLVASASLSVAEYYFSRNQWEKTIETLDTISGELPPESYHHALLMHGISLQWLQKHRLALKLYANIPETSQYYTAARLNMAVADIRQDWWTDAHTIINNLINDKGNSGNIALTDRLYTVLGYSFLQQQYYRNARDAFRNVSLNGIYTNKALLGIALCAAYQDDLVGALNAVKILKDKKGTDLPVDEANLLMPYFYEKLQQHATANAGYLEAVKYYEDRITGIKAIQIDSDELVKKLAGNNTDTVTVSGEAVDLDEKLPKSFFDNIRLLTMFHPDIQRIGNTALLYEYNKIYTEYENYLHKATQESLDKKIIYLTHYMNQCRYGLARMQDHDATIPH